MKKLTFPFSLKQFQEKMCNAVNDYWNGRLQQAKSQVKRGMRDTGTRSEVTGGHQLDGIGKLLYEIAVAAGFSSENIYFNAPLPLPGYYRPQKKWDFAVCRNGKLIAAVELKSQCGSFGNNFNNRAEEAIGLAHDFWVAYREKAFGVIPCPWLVFFFLLEETEESQLPVKLHSSPIKPLAKFENTSYQTRYQILCETLVLERDFTMTSLVLSHRPMPKEHAKYSEPIDALSFVNFCKSFYSHLRLQQND